MKRHCGGCTLCCKLLPVRELKKPANVRCAHQRHGKGCMVYGSARMPPACHLWTCRWLVDEETASLVRPDRSHYVIDVMPEFVELQDNATGVKTPIPVVQVWVDPKFPDAHRDPALRAYLLKLAETGTAAIIRYSESVAFTLFAPPMSSDREWHEVQGVSTREHGPQDIVNALGGYSIQLGD